MSTEDARRQVLREFVREAGGYAQVVKKYKLTPSQGSYLSQLIAEGSVASFGERSAANWEERLRLTDGTLVRPGWQAPAEAAEDGAPFLPGFQNVSIPKLNVVGSMGNGNEQHDEVVVGRLTLSPDWISKTLKPTGLENLRFIHGYGDSMEGTFNDGDILLVDGGVRTADIDGVYVLEANQRIFIKRVTERFDGRHEITSDNPKVKTVQLLDGSQPVTILGRVIWAWNGKKL